MEGGMTQDGSPSDPSLERVVGASRDRQAVHEAGHAVVSWQAVSLGYEEHRFPHISMHQTIEAMELDPEGREGAVAQTRLLPTFYRLGLSLAEVEKRQRRPLLPAPDPYFHTFS
jgi:hypothetical protein